MFQACFSVSQALTSSRVAKPLPSLVPITVSIDASDAMSRMRSLTAPLITIATAPSASTAAAARFLGPTASVTVPSTFTKTALLAFRSAIWSKYSCTSAGASSASAPSAPSSNHASASSLGASAGSFAANLEVSTFCERHLVAVFCGNNSHS